MNTDMLRLGIGFVVVLSSAFLAAGGAPGASTSPIPPSFDIYSIGVDGAGRHRLTTDPADESSPSVSSDGRTIAFTRGRDIWLMNTDGTDQRVLVSARNQMVYEQPIWSPTGRQLAFTGVDFSSCRPNEYKCATLSVWIVRGDGTGLRQIHGGGLRGEQFPRWSPDGRRLAFEADVDPDGAESIFVARLSGGGRRVFQSRLGNVGHPSWSANGRWIAFARQGGNGDVVYIVRADGRARRTLRFGSDPEWSPTRDQIALSWRGRVYVVPGRRGRAGKRLAFAESFSWNRRGNRLALHQGGGRISVIRPDGRSFRVVIRESGSLWAEAPAWSRDGRKLFYSLKEEGSPPPA